MATTANQRNISIYKMVVFKTATWQDRTSAATVLDMTMPRPSAKVKICCHTQNPCHSPTMHFMCRYGSINQGKHRSGMAQADGCWSLNIESWFQFQSSQIEFVVDKAALGQVLHQVLQFPVSLTTPTLHT
jgi:hypothetical protein